MKLMLQTFTTYNNYSNSVPCMYFLAPPGALLTAPGGEHLIDFLYINKSFQNLQQIVKLLEISWWKSLGAVKSENVFHDFS